MDCSLTQDDAARIIQTAWRSHVDKQVFRFYKDLIGFHTKMMNSQHFPKSNGGPTPHPGGAPASKQQQRVIEKSSLVTATSKQCAATILRLISPKEAQLMDDAAGTHIRFRLASPSKLTDASVTTKSKFGSFPPAVYYKIYTHRPIVDLCATAPRNYTLPSNKVSLPKQQFNNKNKKNGHQRPGFLQDPTSGWYQRSENNEWRAISDSLLLSSIRVISDIKTSPSDKKKSRFKPTITQRRLKRHNDNKRKRIDWLAKIYFQNSQENAEETDDDLKAAVEDLYVVSKETQEVENDPWSYCHDIDHEIADADIQALIEWTDCLDYDDYSNYWSHLGTAGFPSVDILGVKKAQKIKQQIFDCSHEHSRGQSGAQSSTLCTYRSLETTERSYNTPRSEAEKVEDREPKTVNFGLENEAEENFDDDYWTLEKLEQMSRPVSGRITVRK